MPTEDPYKPREETFEESLKENVPLAQFTTLGVGGPARYFAEISNVDALAAAIRWARDRKLPLFVLGGGSNVVIADAGFPGLVARISIPGVEARVEGESAFIKAGAGEDWDRLVASCVAAGYAGFECLSGIPGRVGATPVQNVGAYGQETGDTLVSVEAFDLASGKMVEIGAGECELGYRASRFKHRDNGRFILTGVTYKLAVGGAPSIKYPELKRYLQERGAADPTLADVRAAVLALRERKAMVINPRDPDSRSVGSFFVNPVVTREHFERIKRRAALLAEDADRMPSFPSPDGRVKLSAAWMIERAGFRRGHVRGGVGTSTKHALAIVNRGGTAREILELAEEIREGVRRAFDVVLAPEPVFVGFE